MVYRSLVQTNDHLLKELDETRQRHQHEVEQLSWSYNQLKKTFTDTSTSRPSDGHVGRHTGQALTLKGDGNASAVLYDSDT